MPTPLFNDDKAAYKLHFFPPYLMHMLLIHPTRPDYMNNSPFLQHIMSTRNHKVLSISNIIPNDVVSLLSYAPNNAGQKRSLICANLLQQ
jgi:hypothetical protein